MAPHQDDNCFGRPELIVRVTDANGAVYEATTNEAGNFWLDPATSPIAAPFHVSVLLNNVETPMRGEVTDGNCNACHTRDGAEAAPGRITP